DNDGRIDMVLVHLSEPVAVLRNEADTGGNHWLGIDLRGKDNADVVGARIALEMEDGTQTRVGTGGGSYASSGDRRHVFGLGKAAKAGKLTVTWPDGNKQSWEGLAVDRYWRITEGEEPRDMSKK
ncbi:MAG TPA: ASPIC/UnbV domain-containing protein, partial [Gemmataceae bacterium]|nr:ASPIC/UnbV domain-containing protein [Gemmataceae bacterium]